MPPSTDLVDPVLRVSPLGFPWRTPDPFLACMYHQDAYPAGTAALGPAASLDAGDGDDVLVIAGPSNQYPYSAAMGAGNSSASAACCAAGLILRQVLRRMSVNFSGG